MAEEKAVKSRVDAIKALPKKKPKGTKSVPKK